MYSLWSILLLSYTAQLTWCWGDLGHRTVAYLAAKYLNEQGAQLVEDLITPDEKFDISDAAVWPDHQKFKLPFTRPWHFIDAKDNPPNLCHVSYQTDCSVGGCVISAIENMVSDRLCIYKCCTLIERKYRRNATDGKKTHQVLDLSLEKTQQGDALKFLMHFIGDLQQPLHVENTLRGGNDLHVCFDNHCAKNTNLHSVWDTEIPHKLNGLKHKPKHNEEKEPAMRWAEKLFQSQGLRTLQAECSDIKRPLICPMIWATETNRLNCDFVLKKGVEWLTDHDLGGEYYKDAAPIVEAQILNAGIRLAVWLNALAADRASSEDRCHYQCGKMRIQRGL